YTRNSYPSLVSGQFKCKGLRSLRVFFCFNFSHTPTNIIEPKNYTFRPKNFLNHQKTPLF
ncbi:hypothetical protein, partial [Scopulibacillus cellulosilyticus]